jgi:hypothetical protein
VASRAEEHGLGIAGTAPTRLTIAVDRMVRLPLAAVIVGAIALRLAAGIVFPASETETYEFGHLAEKIADGNGYVFADDPVGRVYDQNSMVSGRLTVLARGTCLPRAAASVACR